MRRQRANSLAAQKTATQVSRCNSLERSSRLIDMMVNGLGGPQRFLEFWTSEIQRLSIRQRSTVRLLRFCEMLMKADMLERKQATRSQ